VTKKFVSPTKKNKNKLFLQQTPQGLPVSVFENPYRRPWGGGDFAVGVNFLEIKMMLNFSKNCFGKPQMKF
jgi:hypothetical protein